MSFTNVVAAGVQPHIRVPMACTIALSVLQHSFQHIRDRAVVSAAITRRQHDDVAVLGHARIPAHALGVLGYAEVPFWLALEVARLRGVVVGDDDGWDCFAGAVVAVVFDWHVAVEAEEDDEDCDGGDGKYYASVRHGIVSRE